MKKLFTLIAIATLLGLPVYGQTPTENTTAPAAQEQTGSSAIDLNSRVDFGKYSIAAPAGMLGQSPAENQYQFFLPDKRYTMITFVATGKPKNLRKIAIDAARSLKLNPARLTALEVNGMKGLTVSQRQESKIITYALLQKGSEMVTVIIAENESLQPAGPKAVATLE